MCDPVTRGTSFFTLDPYMNLNFPLLLTGRGSPNGYYKIIRIAALQKKEESFIKKWKGLIKKSLII